MEIMKKEMEDHLRNVIIPFWKRLRDNEYGGYYGYMDFDGVLDKKAVKGCILNSRITWFFANAYLTLKDESLLSEAKHAFEFMKRYCIDKENGGVYWSLCYDATPSDTTKHTYNQAFAIYALSTYYDATKDLESLEMAQKLYEIIEGKCRDEGGYLEAFDREFNPVSNEKLSENGVMATRTMNTLLHVFEAYCEFYRVTKREDVKEKIEWILDTIADRIYNKELKRQEVFFDRDYNSLIDLHSYGHDIETAWLVDRGVEILDEPYYKKKMLPITRELTRHIYEEAFDGHSLANECERGVVNADRVWWVQAEAVVGFVNGYENNRTHTEYLKAAKDIWEYIKEYVVDKREGMEWFWLLDKYGVPYKEKPVVEPWKCPYHNGRMCMEIIRRDI